MYTKRVTEKVINKVTTELIHQSLQWLPLDAGFVSGSMWDCLLDVNLINSAFQQDFLKVKQPDYKAEHSPRHTVEANGCETTYLPPHTPSWSCPVA